VTEPLIFEISRPGRCAAVLPALDVPPADLPDGLVREHLPLPEVSELDLVRHYTRLSHKNHAVDIGFYPLGSCTMKLNPQINEATARLPGFAHLHPYQDEETVQGAIFLMYHLQEFLKEIGGFAAVSLQPAAGAHGELTGVLMMRAYHLDRGDDQRNGNHLAGMMLTNPNTLGLFDEHVEQITGLVHEYGGLMYGDGANMNALLGITRPGDVGFDVLHYNLHKTFSTPHGGGGPGSGPVGASERLADFLPSPIVAVDLEWSDDENEGEFYTLVNPPKSIGRVKAFYGQFGVLVKAYTYVRMLGPDGLRRVAEYAVLNANYLMSQVKDTYPVPYNRICMHEFVLAGPPKDAQAAGVHTMDVAKRLMDFGFHPPTVYFPLIVPEALMIEPTETESKETLDAFADALLRIAEEARTNPDLLHEAPHSAPVRRLDEVRAAKELVLRWEPEKRQ
jgi:glycine dehydrogenase subunit 2